MYCSVDEAFDNNTQKKQNNSNNINKFNNSNNINKCNNSNNINNKCINDNDYDDNINNNSDEQNNVLNNLDNNDNYSENIINNGEYYTDHYSDSMINYPNHQSSFFTAQGDYLSNRGTKITDLNITDKYTDEYTMPSYDESLSLLDSDYLDSNDIAQTENKPQYSHNYCINKFISSITNNNDSLSILSDENNGIYDHIKQCKYCRTQINLKMKNFYNKPQKNNKNEITNFIENFDVLSEKIIGYEFKDVLIIILIGIIIIFLLDFFVKIGRKTMKLELK